MLDGVQPAQPEAGATPPPPPEPPQPPGGPPFVEAAPGCKIFIGGLPHDISSEELGEYFKTYGAVKDAVAMTQRGFGFIEYLDPASAEAALEAAPHVLHGREVAVKKAASRESMAQVKAENPSDGQFVANKLFVGGLPHHVETAQLADYFSQYGVLSDAVVIAKRGFGFVAFHDQAAAAAVMADAAHHIIDGQPITVKYADGMRPDRGGGMPVRQNGAMPARYPSPAMGGMAPPVGGDRWQGPTKIFVGGLPKDMATLELNQYFAWYGRLSDCVVMAGRGFGFVEFEDPEAARAAIVDEAKHVIRGMHVSVKFADGKGGKGMAPPAGPPMPAAGGPWGCSPAPCCGAPPCAGGGAWGCGQPQMGMSPAGPWGGMPADPWGQPALPAPGQCGQSGASGSRLIVRGIPVDAVDAELQAYFAYYGPLVDCRVAAGRGFGHVTFSSWEAAELALHEPAGHEMRGHRLSLRPDGPVGSAPY